MPAFEITLNKKQRWIIGVSKRGGVSAEVHFARRTNKQTQKDSKELLLSLGGLEEINDGVHDYLTWATKSLAIGDEIVIRVVSAKKFDPVLERRRERRSA